MIKKIPITINVNAEDEFHVYKQLNDFLRTCFREFAATYGITDYEVIVREQRKFLCAVMDMKQDQRIQ